MPLKVQKSEPKESPQKLVFRFIKKVKNSGILLEARKRQFWQPKLNKRARKEKAFHRAKMEQYYQRLKKLGKI